MEKLVTAAKGLVSRGLQQLSDETSRRERMLEVRSSRPMPAILSKTVDVDLPRSLWCAWKPNAEEGASVFERHIRRPLMDSERRDLLARRDELEPWVCGYHESERDTVAIALLDMFGSFPSMRQTSIEAASRVDSASRLLKDFPAWAIKRACQKTQTNGTWRGGVFDRQWPPSDPELIAAVRDEVRLYADQHRSAVALLAAAVEG